MDWLHRVVWGTLLVAVLLSVGAFFWYLSPPAEPGRVCVDLFLLLSTLYCILLLLVRFSPAGLLSSGFIGLFAVLELSKTLLFAAYVLALRTSWIGPRIFGVGEVAALLLVLLVIVGAVRLTWHILSFRAPSVGAAALGHPRLGRLAAEPFWTLMGFFVIFLYAAYLLGFALAFHDKGTSGPGLYATPAERGAEDFWQGRRAGNATGARVRSAACTGGESTPGTVRWLGFLPGRASLECAEAALNGLAAGTAAAELPLADQISREMEEHAVCQGGVSAPTWQLHRNLAVHNVVTLLCLRDELLQQDGYRRVRLVLVGHATEVAPAASGAFRSNYELSLARVQQVHRILSDLVDRSAGGTDPGPPPNVEWLLSPVSSEDTFLAPGDGGTAPPPDLLGDPKLTVEVAVHPLPGHLSELEMQAQRRVAPTLGLLDYMYFMIYTITTTGYGDFIPVSPVAKFITMVANLFEVFFLVIVVNVLFELLRSYRGREAGA